MRMEIDRSVGRQSLALSSPLSTSLSSARSGSVLPLAGRAGKVMASTVLLAQAPPGAQHAPAAPSGSARARSERAVFEFTSSVDASLARDVEALFYFHPRQQALMESIRASVEAFGVPEVMKRGARVHLGIPQNGAQCLFACHPTRRPGVPVGVVVYLRTSRELIHILHLVVDAAYSQGGRFAELGLALQLVDEVRALARRISGVRNVQLPYRQRQLAVKRPSGG